MEPIAEEMDSHSSSAASIIDSAMNHIDTVIFNYNIVSVHQSAHVDLTHSSGAGLGFSKHQQAVAEHCLLMPPGGDRHQTADNVSPKHSVLKRIQ